MPPLNVIIDVLFFCDKINFVSGENMKNIDRVKLSKEIYDTILHRKCVLRSGTYLSYYLDSHGRKEIAKQLIDRCLVHDISKLEDTREFAALASIIDQNDSMKNVAHKLTDRQREMISLHWKNNSHHPEHYPSPNDMTELDILEMACDCHARSKQWGTNPLEYISLQQDIRFHFDDKHYKALVRYCTILELASMTDDYKDIFANGISVLFKNNDPIINHLENFSNACYDNRIETDRLILTKSSKSDCASIIYTIKLKDTLNVIGEITILCNGKIYYRIPKKYQNNGYIQEVLLRFKELIKRRELSLEVGETNLLQKQVASDLGFVPTEDQLEGIRTYKFIKQTS